MSQLKDNANYNANSIAQEMHSKCIENFTANEKEVFLEISILVP